MAQITFTIPASKIQLFTDCFGENYDSEVESGAIDGSAITKAQYAKTKAFEFLAQRVKKWNRAQEKNKIEDVDITQ